MSIKRVEIDTWHLPQSIHEAPRLMTSYVNDPLNKILLLAEQIPLETLQQAVAMEGDGMSPCIEYDRHAEGKELKPNDDFISLTQTLHENTEGWRMFPGGTVDHLVVNENSMFNHHPPNMWLSLLGYRNAVGRPILGPVVIVLRRETIAVKTIDFDEGVEQE